MSDLGQDSVNLFGPNEWFRIRVVYSNELFNGGDKIRCAAERAASNTLAGDLPKPSFNKIEPRGETVKTRKSSAIFSRIWDSGLSGQDRRPESMPRQTLNTPPLIISFSGVISAAPHIPQNPTSCGENLLDTQETAQYTSAHKKEILIIKLYECPAIGQYPVSFYGVRHLRVSDRLCAA